LFDETAQQLHGKSLFPALILPMVAPSHFDFDSLLAVPYMIQSLAT